jgi:N-acetylmuramoyl-L-alanine amidase
MNRNTIVLDASHGGIDSGSRIGDSILEKDITLALSFKLRSLLTARGFSVVMTRDSDAANLPNGTKPLTLDDRAGLANGPRAAACLLLHATGAGNGVHLYTSDIAPAPYEVALLPWLTAQAAWAPQSHLLAQQLANALQRAGIAYVNSAAAVRPVDSLTCPAVIVELAPEGDDPASITATDYQQRVAQAIAAALVFWPKQVQPPTRLIPAATPKPDATPPNATPTPKPDAPAEPKP